MTTAPLTVTHRPHDRPLRRPAMSNTVDRHGRIALTNRYVEIDGRPAIPVSGELHYSRVPRADWEVVKEEVMRRAIRAKFEQNRELRELLLETGDEELIHESRSDLFWGRTLDGKGENRLGLILMEIRQALRGPSAPGAGPGS